MELSPKATLVTARKIAWLRGIGQNPPRGAMHSNPVGGDNYHRICNSSTGGASFAPAYRARSNDVFLRHFADSAADKGINIIFEPESFISFWQISAVKTVLDQLAPSFVPSAHFNAVNLIRPAPYVSLLSTAHGEIGFDSSYFLEWGQKKFLAGLIHEVSHCIDGLLLEKVKALPDHSLQTSLGKQINDLAYSVLGEGPTFGDSRMHYFYLSDFTALYLLRGEILRGLSHHPSVKELYGLLKQNIFGGREYLNAY